MEKRRQQGVLTVEASIVLTLLLMLILFLFSFGRVYRAQSLVSHATLQAADAIALESYLRETALQSDAEDVLFLASSLTDSTTLSAENLESLRSADIKKIAREKFVTAVSNSEGNANTKLENLGVKDGLSGIDFSQCKVDLGNDDVIVSVTYTIEMQFPVFGADELTVTKSAKAKTFGEILFEVATEPNVPGWGTTSGDSKVVHGTTVEITATPNYGYKFVKWDDGVTDNPRTVTVTDALHFKAIFEKDKFGVNVHTNLQIQDEKYRSRHSNYATITGAGTYEYLDVITLTATPGTHYEFVGWDDNNNGQIDVGEETGLTRDITVDKTYNLKAIFKPKIYTISVKSNNETYGTAFVQQGNQKGKSVQAEYASDVQLVATVKDNTLYRFLKWNNNSPQNAITVQVKGNYEYVANFDFNTYTVTFKNGNTTEHTTKVIRGSSISSSAKYVQSSMPQANPQKSGAHFNKWVYNNATFTSNTTVKSDITVTAAWNCVIKFNGNGGTVNGAASKTVAQGSTFNFNSIGASRSGYKFNGWYSGSTKYSGNQTINSNITVSANWSCTHPARYEERTGAACTGGTIYYKCTQCGANLGSANYGGIGHSWTARCNIRHNLNWFDGRNATNGCGLKHTPGYSFCIVCEHCSALRGKGYNWCASSHVLGNTGGRPKRYPGQHNYYLLGGEEF